MDRKRNFTMPYSQIVFNIIYNTIAKLLDNEPKKYIVLFYNCFRDSFLSS